MPEPTTAVENANYKLSEEALKSLRNSRHSRKNLGRNASGGSRDQSPPTQLDNSRYSNRSSGSSMWSNIMPGRGRRIYGSAASVASSITCTEFAGDFSYEFETSDRSLDVRQFSNDDINDSKPSIPQRQVSVTAGQSSSLMSTGMTVGSEQVASVQSQDYSVPPLPVEHKRASDLSPQRPGRKTSFAPSSDHTTVVANSLATLSLIHQRNSSLRGSGNSTDRVPQYPSRKTSSKVMDAQALIREIRGNSLKEQSAYFCESLPLASHVHDGRTYENSFSGAEAIDHMMEIGLVCSRQEGIQMGLALQNDLGMLFHLGRDDNKPFCDDDQAVYQLAPAVPLSEPLSPRLVSMRGKTDTSIAIVEEEPLEEATAKQLAIPQVQSPKRS